MSFTVLWIFKAKYIHTYFENQISFKGSMQKSKNCASTPFKSPFLFRTPMIQTCPSYLATFGRKTYPPKHIL